MLQALEACQTVYSTRKIKFKEVYRENNRESILILYICVHYSRAG